MAMFSSSVVVPAFLLAFMFGEAAVPLIQPLTPVEPVGSALLQQGTVAATSGKDVPDEIPTEVSPLVGLEPAPTPSDLKSLRKQAVKAQKVVAALKKDAENAVVPEHCAECVKEFKRAIGHGLPEAQSNEAEALERLKEAATWAAFETKREQSLPGIVRLLQAKAMDKQRRRFQAEQRASQVKKDRIALEKAQETELAAVRKAVARQRFVDKLRAAEDARLADCAVKAAHEVKRKNKDAQQVVVRTRAAAAEKTNQAIEAANVLLSNHTVHVIGEVAKSAVEEVKQDQTVETLRQRVNFLRKQAMESVDHAEQARRSAHIDKERAAEAKMSLKEVLAEKTSSVIESKAVEVPEAANGTAPRTANEMAPDNANEMVDDLFNDLEQEAEQHSFRSLTER